MAFARSLFYNQRCSRCVGHGRFHHPDKQRRKLTINQIDKEKIVEKGEQPPFLTGNINNPAATVQSHSSQNEKSVQNIIML